MDITFKIKGINSFGDIVTIKKKIVCPDFEVLPSKRFDNLILPETSIEEQVYDWFDSIDKKDIMYENDLFIIIDYVIYEKKKNKKLIDLIKSHVSDERMLLDIMAVYSKIKPNLKGLKIEKQFELLLTHLDIGYLSAIESMSPIKNIFKLNGDELKDYKKELK